MGGAMMARPGMNFAMTRELMPQRSKRVCVWLTQESGSSEILQRALRTRMPYLSPIQYQPQSAARHASTDPVNSSGNDIPPRAAMAPATMSVGTAGTGSPIWSRSTLTNTIVSP
jgi:hypothetical protein